MGKAELDIVKACRAELYRCVRENNAEGARQSAERYAAIMDSLADRIKSLKDGARLRWEAIWHRELADLIIKEGISAQVQAAMAMGAASFKRPHECIIPSKNWPEPAPATSVPVTPAPVNTSAHDIEHPVITDPEWAAILFAKHKASVMVIRCFWDNLSEGCTGTGFFISENGYLLTNHHVIHSDYTTKTPDTLQIETGDKKIKCQATVIASDAKKDVALLKLKDHKGKTPYISFVEDYNTVLEGIDILTIGNGLGQGLAPNKGTVKNPCYEKSGDLIYSAQTNGGDSGSPLINRRGLCIGIHKAREDENGAKNARGIAYATSADEIKKLLQTWEKKQNFSL